MHLPQWPFAQLIYQWGHGRIIVAFITEVLAHMRPVTLLDPSIVILMVSAAAREEHRFWTLPQVGHQVVIDELSAIIGIDPQNWKRGRAFVRIGRLLTRFPDCGRGGEDIRSIL